eukprot:5741196-Ditylum_brightwellii.AAC.1
MPKTTRHTKKIKSAPPQLATCSMPKTTRCTNKENFTPPQLAAHDIDDDDPMLVSKKDGTLHGKQLLFVKKDLSELYFDIIEDIDANDNDYDPNVRHLISYPNNNKIKQA